MGLWSPPHLHWMRILWNSQIHEDFHLLLDRGHLLSEIQKILIWLLEVTLIPIICGFKVWKFGENVSFPFAAVQTLHSICVIVVGRTPFTIPRPSFLISEGGALNMVKVTFRPCAYLV